MSLNCLTATSTGKSKTYIESRSMARKASSNPEKRKKKDWKGLILDSKTFTVKVLVDRWILVYIWVRAFLKSHLIKSLCNYSFMTYNYSFFNFNFMDTNITESSKFKHNFNKALTLLWYVYVNIEIPRLIQSETDWNWKFVKASNFRSHIHITDQYNW